MPQRLPNKVRIIGGKWRGRKLAVANAEGLRPTLDRARETLFNWLTAEIADARVLDLFAGTGALGFEALSRGARHATLVEADRRAVGQLEAANVMLDAAATIVHGRAADYLRRTKDLWDVVFVDPPFGEPEHFNEVLDGLSGRLASAGIVYVEHPRRMDLRWPGYQEWKSSDFGEVTCRLLRA